MPTVYLKMIKPTLLDGRLYNRNELAEFDTDDVEDMATFRELVAERSAVPAPDPINGKRPNGLRNREDSWR